MQGILLENFPNVFGFFHLLTFSVLSSFYMSKDTYHPNPGWIQTDTSKSELIELQKESGQSSHLGGSGRKEKEKLKAGDEASSESTNLKADLGSLFLSHDHHDKAFVQGQIHM